MARRVGRTRLGLSPDASTGRKLPHVVVVGAGFAGRRAERVLAASGACRVTLLDCSGVFEYVPSALRCCVQPAHAARAVLPQPARCARAQLHSVELSPASDGARDARRVTALLLADGTRLPCDFVLFATGSDYAPPIKPPLAPSGASASASANPAADPVAARRAHYRGVCVRLEAAASVLVVGGGTVGVELAAEVAARFGRRKTVTLVSATPTLLPRMPRRAGAAAERWLRAAGVTLLLGERVADWGGAATAPPCWGTPGEWRVVTASGATLSANAVFNCAGGAPRAAYLAGVPGALAPSGAIAVQPTMRLCCLANAFAAGDVAEHGAEATALAADLSADVAAGNLLRLLRAPRGGRGAGMQPLAPVPHIACVSLGPFNGVLQFNALVLSGPPAAALKWLIETLQLGAAREAAGYAPLWRAIEAANVALGARLFLLRRAAAAA